MSKPLPRPVTTQEIYIAEILTELQAIGVALRNVVSLQPQSPAPPTAPQAIEPLREPAVLRQDFGVSAQSNAHEPAVQLQPEPTAPMLTFIPTDFPGRDLLIAAGINALELIPRDGDALVDIPGIGKVTAGRILARLS